MTWYHVIATATPTAVPTVVVSALIVYLNHRANRRLEQYKTELARQLACERAKLEETVLRRSAWYDKRSNALVELYGAFQSYLEFLRRHLYFDAIGGDVTPMHDFRESCDKLSVFLTDDLKAGVDQYAFELMQFWNWAVLNREHEQEEIRRRLDYEIPGYLGRLRVDIGRYMEESLSAPSSAARSNNEYRDRT